MNKIKMSNNFIRHWQNLVNILLPNASIPHFHDSLQLQFIINITRILKHIFIKIYTCVLIYILIMIENNKISKIF